MIIFSWNLLLIRVTRQASSRNFVWTSDRNPNYRKCRNCIINGKCKKWMVILQLLTPSNIYIKLSLVFLQVSNFPSQFRGSICLFTPSNIYKIVTCISPSFKFSFTSFESEKQNEMNGTFAINNANISTKNENRNKPNISIWLLFLSPSNMKVLFNFNLITFTGYYICLFQFDCMLYANRFATELAKTGWACEILFFRLLPTATEAPSTFKAYTAPSLHSNLRPSNYSIIQLASLSLIVS